MRYEYTYDVHKSVEEPRVRHRERHFGHLRALKGGGRGNGLLSRVVRSVSWLRSRPRQISDDGQVLTDKVCRLADGSRGRVAIRQSQGEWVEVCVPARVGR